MIPGSHDWLTLLWLKWRPNSNPAPGSGVGRGSGECPLGTSPQHSSPLDYNLNAAPPAFCRLRT